MRWGARMGNTELVDLMVHDGLWCAFDNVHMAQPRGERGQGVRPDARGVRRYAAQSQQRAGAAMAAGRLDDELTPFPIPQRKGDPVMFSKDEQPRPETTAEGLAKLRPVLGTEMITAGNAPSVNDGGAALIVCTEERAAQLGKQPLAYIRGEAHVALKPYQFPIAPAFAVQKLLDKTGRKLADIDVLEVNEAFAAVALACGKVLDWDPAPRQPERRRGRLRAPHRHERRADHDDAGVRA